MTSINITFLPKDKSMYRRQTNQFIRGQGFTENSVSEFNISLYFLIQFSCNQIYLVNGKTRIRGD